jgi:hypothetical protein
VIREGQIILPAPGAATRVIGVVGRARILALVRVTVAEPEPVEPVPPIWNHAPLYQMNTLPVSVS